MATFKTQRKPYVVQVKQRPRFRQGGTKPKDDIGLPEETPSPWTKALIGGSNTLDRVNAALAEVARGQMRDVNTGVAAQQESAMGRLAGRGLTDSGLAVDATQNILSTGAKNLGDIQATLAANQAANTMAAEQFAADDAYRWAALNQANTQQQPPAMPAAPQQGAIPQPNYAATDMTGGKIAAYGSGMAWPTGAVLPQDQQQPTMSLGYGVTQGGPWQSYPHAVQSLGEVSMGVPAGMQRSNAAPGGFDAQGLLSAGTDPSQQLNELQQANAMRDALLTQAGQNREYKNIKESGQQKPPMPKGGAVSGSDAAVQEYQSGSLPSRWFDSNGEPKVATDEHGYPAYDADSQPIYQAYLDLGEALRHGTINQTEFDRLNRLLRERIGGPRLTTPGTNVVATPWG